MVITSIAAIFGYLRAAQLFKDELNRKAVDVTEKPELGIKGKREW